MQMTETLAAARQGNVDFFRYQTVCKFRLFQFRLFCGDGFFNFLAWGTNSLSYAIRGFQSGRVQQYALIFFLGVLLVILIMIL